jgi:hypothetical protein
MVASVVFPGIPPINLGPKGEDYRQHDDYAQGNEFFGADIGVRNGLVDLAAIEVLGRDEGSGPVRIRCSRILGA